MYIVWILKQHCTWGSLKDVFQLPLGVLALFSCVWITSVTSDQLLFFSCTKSSCWNVGECIQAYCCCCCICTGCSVSLHSHSPLGVTWNESMDRSHLTTSVRFSIDRVYSFLFTFHTLWILMHSRLCDNLWLKCGFYYKLLDCLLAEPHGKKEHILYNL